MSYIPSFLVSSHLGAPEKNSSQIIPRHRRPIETMLNVTQLCLILFYQFGPKLSVSIFEPLIYVTLVITKYIEEGMEEKLEFLTKFFRPSVFTKLLRDPNPFTHLGFLTCKEGSFGTTGRVNHLQILNQLQLASTR